MQTVKNLYLWSSRSYLRKFLEVPLALYIDLIWSKRRTMEIYLNIAQWGPGIYGIEAAAQHHFKRSAKRLSRAQASLLAVTLPNPILRNPRKPNRGMRRLAKLVESRSPPIRRLCAVHALKPPVKCTECTCFFSQFGYINRQFTLKFLQSVLV